MASAIFFLGSNLLMDTNKCFASGISNFTGCFDVERSSNRLEFMEGYKISGTIRNDLKVSLKTPSVMDKKIHFMLKPDHHTNV